MIGRLLAALAWLWSAGAGAHAELLSSDPPDRARLQTAPTSVELRFNEPVTPLSMKLFSSATAPVVLEAPVAASAVLRLPLPAELPDGAYTLSFRVTSLDSHPVGGSIAFSVGAATVPAPVLPEPDALRPWRVGVRAVRDLALLIAAGAAIFVHAIARFPGERRLLVGSALVALIATFAAIGLQGAAMLGAPLWAFEALRTALHSSYGLSAGVAALGSLLIAGGFLRLGAATIIASFPLTGHAAAAGLGSLAPFALAMHALAAAFWTGSLAALLLNPTASALRRFSRIAIFAVPVLLAAGVAFAIQQLHSLADLTRSDYGLLIVGKFALLAALLLLATLNRFRLLPKLERGESAATNWLRRSIAAELALVTCVAALTAVLVQTPPPEAPWVRTVQAMGRSAELSVAPARAGQNRVSVRFRNFEPQEVLLEMGNAAAGVEPIGRPMRLESTGHYIHEGPELAFAGAWTIEIQARIGDFDKVVFRADVQVYR